ncbi:MAG: hypothetical protein ABSA47_01880 [Verrucomicrobiota bacterium]
MKSSWAPAAAGLSLLCAARAATITENFVHNPFQDGWQIFGDTNLFQWDSKNQVLDVTWDSSQPNSYFYHPLGTILGTNDDFSMSFDLVLTDYTVGGNAGFPSDFPVATGLLNYSEATGSSFFRCGWPTQPDLAEFDFYQWDDLGDTNTVWPTFFDSANDLFWDGDGSYGVVELPTNILMHVVLNYTAADETCELAITTNGVEVAAPVFADLAEIGTNFGDYHLDTFAVESYSQVNSEPPGSLLAHGTIGNIVLTVPPPPVTFLQVAPNSECWQVQFASRMSWNYVLESSADLVTWSTNGPVVAGTGGNLILRDTNSLQQQQFYRVNALRAD